MAEHIDTGLRGEELAADYLAACGWQLVGRRWRDGGTGGSGTDIDIIARSPDGVYHFVEVKTRTRSVFRHGDFSPEAAVTAGKTQRMLQAAERYMGAQGLGGEIAVDLVAVVLESGTGEPEVRYYPDIVR